jgi:hypothetical protein
VALARVERGVAEAEAVEREAALSQLRDEIHPERLGVDCDALLRVLHAQHRVVELEAGGLGGLRHCCGRGQTEDRGID